MKKHLLTILSVMLTTLTSMADESSYEQVIRFYVDQFGYDVTSENTVTLISGRVSDAEPFELQSTVEYEGKTYTITAIGDAALQNCGFTSVVIPSTVTSIGRSASCGKVFTRSLIYPRDKSLR